jgi:hypothetical protein
VQQYHRLLIMGLYGIQELVVKTPDAKIYKDYFEVNSKDWKHHKSIQHQLINKNKKKYLKIPKQQPTHHIMPYYKNLDLHVRITDQTPSNAKIIDSNQDILIQYNPEDTFVADYPTYIMIIWPKIVNLDTDNWQTQYKHEVYYQENGTFLIIYKKELAVPSIGADQNQMLIKVHNDFKECATENHLTKSQQHIGINLQFKTRLKHPLTGKYLYLFSKGSNSKPFEMDHLRIPRSIKGVIVESNKEMKDGKFELTHPLSPEEHKNFHAIANVKVTDEDYLTPEDRIGAALQKTCDYKLKEALYLLKQDNLLESKNLENLILKFISYTHSTTDCNPKEFFPNIRCYSPEIQSKLTEHVILVSINSMSIHKFCENIPDTLKGQPVYSWKSGKDFPAQDKLMYKAVWHHLQGKDYDIPWKDLEEEFMNYPLHKQDFLYAPYRNLALRHNIIQAIKFDITMVDRVNFATINLLEDLMVALSKLNGISEENYRTIMEAINVLHKIKKLSNDLMSKIVLIVVNHTPLTNHEPFFSKEMLQQYKLSQEAQTALNHFYRATKGQSKNTKESTSISMAK